MKKVTAVRFDRVLSIGGVRTNECTEASHGPMEHDGLVIRVAGKEVPLARVEDMTTVESRVQCERCDQTFQDARALAGHTYHIHEKKKTK